MQYSLFAQLMARDPRKVVRYPDVPLDEALTALREIQGEIVRLKSAPPAAAAAPAMPGMPPVVPVETSGAEASEGGATEPVPVAALEVVNGSLANLATQVWRARNRLVDPSTGEPLEETRRLFRHVDGANEALAQMGVVIKDWVNQPYDSGLPVKVLTFQPAPEVQRDTVLEAVRPTVIWRDQLLQMGEVIVGIPPPPEQKPQ